VTDFRCAIVVPVYNHSATVREVVEKALKFTGNVIVVDDGSNNGVATRLQGLNARLLRHESNRGKGAAILTGAAEARRMGMTHIITIDADGQHDPGDAPVFLSVIHENPSAIIIGKRRFDATVPGLSRFGRAFSNFWFRIQTGHSIGDIQSGFRAYPLSVLERLNLRERRYSFEIETPVKAAWAGVPVKDVDISVYYPPRDKRISHFRLFRDNLRLTILNTRLTTRAMLPWPHHKLYGDPSEADRISVLHPLRSLRILTQANLHPWALGLSAALGVFLGALPLVGCKPVIILGSASYFRLNKAVAFTASQICIPPFAPALCIEAGYFVRHGHFLTEISLKTIGYQALQRYFEWVLGFFVIAPLLAVVVGLGIYLLSAWMRRGLEWKKWPLVKKDQPH
jgi:hypothetical protein